MGIESRIYLGIDPGVNGGIAVVYTDRTGKGQSLKGLIPCQVHGWLSRYKSGAYIKTIAFIEKVGGYIPSKGEGTKKGPDRGSHIFTFGRSYGNLEIALAAVGIQMVEVPPKEWQKGLSITPKINRGPYKESQEDWKRRLKVVAQERFPNIKVTLGICDALLIGLYGMLLREGKLE